MKSKVSPSANSGAYGTFGWQCLRNWKYYPLLCPYEFTGIIWFAVGLGVINLQQNGSDWRLQKRFLFPHSFFDLGCQEVKCLFQTVGHSLATHVTLRVTHGFCKKITTNHDKGNLHSFRWLFSNFYKMALRFLSKKSEIDWLQWPKYFLYYVHNIDLYFWWYSKIDQTSVSIICYWQVQKLQ